MTARDDQARDRASTALTAIASAAVDVMRMTDMLIEDMSDEQRTVVLANAINAAAARMGLLAEMAATDAGCPPVGFKGTRVEDWLLPVGQSARGRAS